MIGTYPLVNGLVRIRGYINIEIFIEEDPYRLVQEYSHLSKNLHLDLIADMWRDP